MRFHRVRLRNFKCYDDADLTLGEGVTVIHGLNGSGKSSLLEACFFALYGARALEKTLDDVITIGAEEASIELWFSHGGNDYRIERELKVRGDSAQTTTCVLETPDRTVEGARDVRAAVADLLRMDASAFVNCAYVRQGEVNKLINASPGERQDMIDDLLQLGKLEDYRERASDARVGVGRVRGGKEELLDDIENQIAEKEAKDLHDRLNSLQSTLSERNADIERYEENRERAQKQFDDATAVLEEHEERKEELEAVESDIEELTDAIAETEREREQRAERITDLREQADELRDELGELLADTDLDAESAEALDDDTLDDRLATLREDREAVQERIQTQTGEIQKHSSAAENAHERAQEFETQAATAREEADDLEAELEETRERIQDQREQVESLGEEIETARAAFDDAPVSPEGADDHREAVAEELAEVNEAIAGLKADLKNAREAVAEAERLLEEGKCPECGQPVDDSPHVESVDDDRERVADLEADLEDLREQREDLQADLERAEDLVARADDLADLQSERETLEQLVEERASGLDSEEERIADLRERAEELDEQAEAKREAAAESEANADEARQTMGELNGESAELKAAIERVETIAARYDDLDATTDEIEKRREERSSLEEQNDLRRDQLADKRERKADLADAVDESVIDDARTKKQKAENYLDQVEPKLEELRSERDDLQATVGAVEQEISALEELRERRDDLAATVERLDSLYMEAHQLQEMYADLRAELRQRNVTKLERMLNETFDLVYGNDAYSHIELDGDYELTVYQKDGEPLDPEQLSGGERAIFNLSLRCAIYRLLSEGIEGTAPMPPLILDEPTVFLDSGHVSKLVELVESMRRLGVEQIVVVSHDEELVGAADDLVTVRKDPTTNRSDVERADAADAAALASFG
ncbi:DNA double-strand break repair ATPase Rad50 [Halorarius litoreus]|uniref:DNA double-strand break repair ATPase Rad50 n=1 Tax=Halorarius litoreus TaxID=2962676 RepID=UPI0020CFBBDE|nr:DNA double-strand break repair ATPase Rad50 [Halorarius litoreus]